MQSGSSIIVKSLSLLLWVTQFGLSVLFPVCFFLALAVWLRTRFGLGLWVVAAMGVIGLLISFRTARICARELRKEAERAGNQSDLPIAFNDHE